MIFIHSFCISAENIARAPTDTESYLFAFSQWESEKLVQSIIIIITVYYWQSPEGAFQWQKLQTHTVDLILINFIVTHY